MHDSLRWLVAMAFVMAWTSVNAQMPIGDFSSATPGGGLPSGWRLAKLPGVAATRFEMAEVDGVTALRMDAADAGAALYRPVRIDPAQTPMLRWRWRADQLVDGADLRRKDGDDVPARLYVMFDYPLERLSLIERGQIKLARTVAGAMVPTAALCYVWDGRLAADTSLWNAYTDRVRVIVVESGKGRLGQWVDEQRDVAADFRAAFGEEAPPITGIAVGADTDQTGETVRGWFGDNTFSETER
ncbi:MAG: DUF3047 domain-containing protein [Thiohalocapsa sp.]